MASGYIFHGMNGEGEPAEIAAEKALSAALPLISTTIAGNTVDRTIPALLAEQPRYPAAFGAAGNGVTNDTAALSELFGEPGTKILPPGTYLVDPLLIDTPNLNIVLSAGATIKLRAVPNFGDGTNYYAAAHAVIQFTPAAVNSSLTGAGTISGNREVTAAKWLAYPHYETYGNGSYVIGVPAFGIWSDAAGFRCEGITITDCIGGGIQVSFGDRQTWRDITVRNCSKVFNLQSLSRSLVEGIYGINIRNKLANGTPIPYWQHAFEWRYFDHTTMRGLYLDSGYAPLIFDNDGFSIGDFPPCAYVGERCTNCTFSDFETAPYVVNTGDTRQAVHVIGGSLSGCSDNRVRGLTFLGYSLGFGLNSSARNIISDFLFDGLYNLPTTTDATGIAVTGGGIGQIPATAGINPDYRLNAGSDRNLWIGGTVRRFKVGVNVTSPDNDFVSVQSEANTFDGWQAGLGVPNTSFPGSVPQRARRINLVGCSGNSNGRSGILFTDSDQLKIEGGAWNDNGQEIQDAIFGCGIAAIGTGAMNGLSVSAEATDTQSYTQAQNISFAPGATDAKNQKRIVLMDRSRVGLGQYIKIVNGTGSADVTAKVVNIDQDILTVQTATPVTFSATGNIQGLTGTLTVSANPVIVVGTGTAFLTEIKGPCYILMGGALLQVSKVIDNTHLQLFAAPTSTLQTNTTAFMILCAQTGIPSQQRGAYIAAAATTVSLRISGLEKNVDRPIAWESFGSFVDGQELVYHGDITPVSTTDTDTPLLPTLPGHLGWVATGYRFQVTQTITGTGGGQVAFVLGSDTDSIVIDPGVPLTKNSGRAGVAPLYPQPASGVFPVARLIGHASLPTGGQVRGDLIIRKLGPTAYAPVA